MTFGLAVVAVAVFLMSRVGDGTTYAQLLPGFVLMGLGMGFTMSPMSTAAMNAVSSHKAGVASGILSMSRMVGGTFGVAAVGALFQHLSTSRIDSRLAGLHLSSAQHSKIVDSMGTGQAKEVLKTFDPHTASQVGAAMKDGFVHALSGALTLSCGAALLGAFLALTLAESKRRPGAAHVAGAPQAMEPAAPTPEQVAA